MSFIGYATDPGLRRPRLTSSAASSLHGEPEDRRWWRCLNESRASCCAFPFPKRLFFSLSLAMYFRTSYRALSSSRSVIFSAITGRAAFAPASLCLDAIAVHTYPSTTSFRYRHRGTSLRRVPPAPTGRRQRQLSFPRIHLSCHASAPCLETTPERSNPFLRAWGRL
jgi:hypothetical protein